MNKTAAKEWLIKSWHHLSSAQLLFNANHYTDTIAVEVHYSVEITLKAFFAYKNMKLIKSHDLIEIHAYIEDEIDFTQEELALLDQISTYHIKEAYPNIERTLPTREEIKEVLEFAEKLLEEVSYTLSINLKEIKQ